MGQAFDLTLLSSGALDLAQRWCAIPSVRGNDVGLAAMADELGAWLGSELGAEMVPAGLACSPAIVHARIDAGRPRTVILYNMYDVMPAEAEGWQVDPFAGEILDLPGMGPSLVARGAENNKGPLAGMLTCVRAFVQADTLPVNIEIILEGEEESGSRGLRSFLASTECPLRTADAALFASLCEYGGGAPRLYLGFSGMAKGTISVAGGVWGGPSAPIHSSNAAWIANPASRLVEALALLAEPPTGRLASVALDDEAKALIAELATTFDPAAELAFRKTQRYATPGPAESLLATVLTTASLNLSWLATDPAQGDAVIPTRASAGYDIRTPPGIAPDQIIATLKAKLFEAGIEGVEIAADNASPGYRFARTSFGVDALLDVYRDHGSPAQIWPWALGSAPAHAFAPYAPSFLIGGLGRGGNAHGVDEFMALKGLERFISSIVGWLEAVGGEADTHASKESKGE